MLSSDWRKQDVLKEGIESAFEEHGIPSLYSSTPDLDQATPGWDSKLGFGKLVGVFKTKDRVLIRVFVLSCICSIRESWTDLLQKGKVAMKH